MPLLILLLNYLSVARGAPYLAALLAILEREPTLLADIVRQAVASQMPTAAPDSETKETSVDEAKQDASMDGWLILQRARATGYMVISKEDLAVMAADPVTCLEPVMLFFSDRGLGRLKTSAREALDQLRLKVFRCEVLPDDDVPAGVPVEMRTRWREAERKRLQEEQEQSWREAHAKAEMARGHGLQLIRASIPRGCVVTQGDVERIGADPETCMTELLIACAGMRVRTEARDCARVVHLLEASGEEHVRSVSVTRRALAELGLHASPDPSARCDADHESSDHESPMVSDPEHLAELVEEISRFCGSLLQRIAVPG